MGGPLRIGVTGMNVAEFTPEWGDATLDLNVFTLRTPVFIDQWSDQTIRQRVINRVRTICQYNLQPLIVIDGWKDDLPSDDILRDIYHVLYLEGVRHFEILNEVGVPFSDLCKSVRQPPFPEDFFEAGKCYGLWLQQMYPTLKALHANTTVLNAGYTDAQFLEGMYAVGTKGFFDAVACHSYGNHEHPPSLFAAYQAQSEGSRAAMDLRGDQNLELWNTEYGFNNINDEDRRLAHEPCAANQLNYAFGRRYPFILNATPGTFGGNLMKSPTQKRSAYFLYAY